VPGRGFGIEAIVINFSKASDLVPHDWLLMKLMASDVDSKVVIWVREVLVRRTQRVRVGGQISKEVKVNSAVPQGNIFGPLLFLVYVNDTWKNFDPSIRLFPDDCLIYREITNKNNIENLQKDLYALVEWAVEYGMKINPGKCKAVKFTRARVKNPPGHALGDQKNSGCEQL
jgi:hypothetical protein